MNKERRNGMFACVVGVLGLVYFLWSFSSSPELVALPATLEVEQGVACVAEAGGTVTCWGPVVDDSRASDGVSGFFASEGPYRIPEVTDVVDVALDDDVGVCVLTSDGSVSCWQWFEHGARPYAYRYVNEPPSAEMAIRDIVSVPNLLNIASITGGASICAQDVDGAVFCSGWSDDRVLNGFTEIEEFFGAVQLVIGIEETCARFEGAAARCLTRIAGEAMTETSERTLLLQDATLLGRTPGADYNETWCAFFTDSPPACDTSFPAQLDVSEIQGASMIFEAADALCGVFDDDVQCIDNFRAAESERTLQPRDGFGAVVSAEAGRGWACVGEADGRVQCLGAPRATLGDLANTSDSDSPVVVVQSSVSTRLRRLVYAVFAGLAVLGAWMVVRREPSGHDVEPVAA